MRQAAQPSCSPVPVSRLNEVVIGIGPHLRPGTLVLDVGSVKIIPAGIMLRGLPPHVGIVATHPCSGRKVRGTGSGD